MRLLVEHLEEAGWEIVSGSADNEIVTLSKRFGAASVSATLKEDGPDEVVLQRLRAWPEGQGAGRASLTEIIEMMDETGVTARLKVQPFGSRFLGSSALLAFYESCGFSPDPYSADYSAMVRFPEGVDASMSF